MITDEGGADWGVGQSRDACAGNERRPHKSFDATLLFLADVGLSRDDVSELEDIILGLLDVVGVGIASPLAISPGYASSFRTFSRTTSE